MRERKIITLYVTRGMLKTRNQGSIAVQGDIPDDKRPLCITVKGRKGPVELVLVDQHLLHRKYNQTEAFEKIFNALYTKAGEVSSRMQDEDNRPTLASAELEMVSIKECPLPMAGAKAAISVEDLL